MPRYTNGNIPASAMSTFQGKKGLSEFIRRLNGFVAECAQNGIRITVSVGQDIFRDYSGQQYWRTYWKNLGKPGNAAVPGTSNHGLGIAADITGCGNWGSATHATCERIAAKHGLVFPLRNESWHLEGTGFTKGANNAWIDAPVVSGSAGSGNKYFPTVAAFAAVQGGYRAIGYNIVADGIQGPATVAAVRDFQRRHGLPADGIHGPATERALIAAQPKPAAPSIPQIAVDGKWGKGTTKRIQQVLGVTADGVFGKGTIKALQSRVGVAADGIYGTGTKKALQRRLGVAADGVIGAGTIKALQARLNSNTL